MEATFDKRLGQVKSCLSSLLVMSKTGYTLVSLEEDYMEMVGKRLADDIRPLGFKSVAEFLQNIPDVARKDGGGWGADVYRAVADPSTRHIKELVDKTPASKSKGRKSRGKHMQWSRAQVRHYSPPARSRRMGPSYGMEDDDVCDFEDANFFDDGDEMFSDEDMSNYRKEYAPVVVKSGIASKTSKESQVSNFDTCKTPVSKHAASSYDSMNLYPHVSINNNDVNLSQSNPAIASEHHIFSSNTKVPGPVIPSAIASEHHIFSSDTNVPGPVIPSVGSDLDVVVTMAVSPDKFTVQPYMESPKLKALMADMKAFYQETSSQPEDNQGCKVGHHLAASNVAGDWFRMMVTKNINSLKVAVKYIDFGYQSIVDKSKLRRLHPKFSQLPMQAVSAKLAGAHSLKHEVWSLKEKVWFNQRVVGGQFVSEVKEVEQTSDGVVLTLELIDTSSPVEDVYVVNQLFDRIKQ